MGKSRKAKISSMTPEEMEKLSSSMSDKINSVCEKTTIQINKILSPYGLCATVTLRVGPPASLEHEKTTQS